jgi:hypothetical protein
MIIQIPNYGNSRPRLRGAPPGQRQQCWNTIGIAIDEWRQTIESQMKLHCSGIRQSGGNGTIQAASCMNTFRTPRDKDALIDP